MQRSVELSRKTNETDISLKLNLDGKGNSSTDTGIGFLDHMLTLFAKHGLFDMDLKACGDLEVDAHHTVEDVGIVLGQALKDAAGDKKSIRRYGTSYVPMDEALAMVSLDFGGRPYLACNINYSTDRVGDMDTELVEEFFRAVSTNAGMNIHINVLYGSNSHHITEAVFKAFGRALDDAVQVDTRIDGVMSTKGII
ncbi:MAG: imidazoleglycerol-phosphate dehydratase HisB [Clostridiaceae bacterium]